MRPALLLAALPLLGCHLIFPFGVKAPEPDVAFGDVGTSDLGPDSMPVSVGWVKTFGSTKGDRGHAVAIDGQGNLYITGHFHDSVTIGTEKLTSKGSVDVFLVSFSPAGELRWLTSVSGTDWNSGLGLAVDGAGNLYLTGELHGTASFDSATSRTSKGDADIFVASFDGNSGAHRWVRSMGGADLDQGLAVAAATDGTVYVTGFFRGSATIGASATTSKGEGDVFVVSYDAKGNLRWTRTFGGKGEDVGRGVAVDAAGNAYVTGAFRDSVSFGTTTLTSKGSDDVYVASLARDKGTHRWAVSAGHANADTGNALTVDGKGNVYVAGYFYNQINLGGEVLFSGGKSDIFLASYTSAGAHRWSEAYGSYDYDTAAAIHVDGAGEVAVTGWFRDYINVGTSQLIGKGGQDLFAAGYTTAGKARWAVGIGGSHVGGDWGQGVVGDGKGNSYVVGHFWGQVDFRGKSRTSAGEDDVFLLKLSR